jgi:hypothetical protein
MVQEVFQCYSIHYYHPLSMLRIIPAKEEIILAGDLNGHVGDDRNGDEKDGMEGGQQERK